MVLDRNIGAMIWWNARRLESHRIHGPTSVVIALHFLLFLALGESVTHVDGTAHDIIRNVLMFYVFAHLKKIVFLLAIKINFIHLHS